MVKQIFACLMATFGLTTACGQANYENVDVKGFAALMNDPDVVVLDVRTADEFKEGHLVGALNINQAESDFMEKAKIFQEALEKELKAIIQQYMITISEDRLTYKTYSKARK